ncbi:Ell-associated factor Eaf [Aphelenchoides besseyi]|nr:Ell-associated factor Eaf [Aphelenchoides besseyi]
MSAIPKGEYELKIGKSLTESTSTQRSDYHAVRYDFKPKSVVSESAETFIAISENDEVQIAFANGEPDSLTMYKCTSKSSRDGKDCLLIFDEETGEMNLEVLASTFNMKQTRSTDAEIESKLRSEIERRQQRRAEENRSNLIDDLELSESSNDEGGCSSSDEDDDLLASFNLT